jgi:tetratricopeptide (TPR) repeat protein
MDGGFGFKRGEEMMRRKVVPCVVVAAFLLGALSGVAVAKKKSFDMSLFQGVEAEQAALNLLQEALDQAGKGTWERIRVARVYFLSGHPDSARKITSSVVDGKHGAGDLIRIGRLYYEAGDWDKARPLLDKVVEMKPDDEDWLAEIGAYYNLQGDREHAEELFVRSFELDPSNHRNTACAAGSYVGVTPRP